MSETPLPPRTATFAARPCLCCKGHRPEVLEIELHHVHPQFDQRALWGEVRDRTLRPLCRTTHRNVHIYLAAMLTGAPRPRVSRYTKQEATLGYNAMVLAHRAAGKPLPTDGRGE